MINSKLLIILFIIFIVHKMCNKEAKSNESKKDIEKMFPLEKLGQLKLPKKIEITKLKKVKPQIFLRYYDNTNHLYNDGRKIWQPVLKYLKNRAVVDGYRYGLSCLEWHKSILTWNGDEVGLEFHVVHSLVEKNKTIIFIFPLSLVDLRRENFVELSFLKQETNVSTINSLLTKTDQIPSYVCCDPNQGPLVNFNLCPVANAILSQKFFYQYDMNPSLTFYITKPEPFDRYIGMNIRSKLVG